MSDQKTEATMSKMSKIKKIILTFVVGVIAITGIAYKRHLNVLEEAKYYGLEPKHLNDWKEHLKQERF